MLTESSTTARSDVPTLTAALSHSYNKQTPLLFENHAHDGRVEQKTHSPTLTSHCGTGGGNLPLVLNPDAVCIAENIIGRQDHNGGNGVGAQQGVSYTLNTVGVHGVANGFGVRRLTPRECERLQGFPDDWTTPHKIPQSSIIFRHHPLFKPFVTNHSGGRREWRSQSRRRGQDPLSIV